MGSVQTFSGEFFDWEEGLGRKRSWDFMWEKLSMKEFVMGKKISMKGVQHFLALFKKQGTIYTKKFFQLKVRSSNKN